VKGLKPERISIIDDSGRLLADGASDGIGGAGADERQVAYERRMRDQIEAIVSSVVGPGRARVQVTVDFDFNRITQTSDRFDPETRVVRSSQTREEVSASNAGRDGSVTVGNELPGGQQQGQGGAGARDQSKKTEEIVNYEISRTTKTEVIEGGRVNRISVAVLVDGNYVRNDKSELTYQARSKEELERISALVRSAIGFDRKRGDQVEVVNLRFAAAPVSMLNEPDGWLAAMQVTKDDIIRAIELLVMALLGLIVLLLVVRPLVRRMLTPEDAPAPALASSGGDVPTSIATDEDGEVIAIPPSQTSQMIDIAQVQGKVHAQSLEKVGELAQKNPQETVSIIRQWLHESAA
jgi:flagellar M-ring protein FliF